MLVDSHVHLVTARMIENTKKRFGLQNAHIAQRAFSEEHAFITPNFVKFLKATSIEKQAKQWKKEMDKSGIDKALFLPICEDSGELDEFLSIHPDRFKGYVFLDKPTTKTAVKTLRKRVESGRFCGLKLYPCIQQISASDKRLFPLYETAAELSIPVLFHFGITMAPIYDYRYTNPLDLSLPAKLFPDTKFIIAHFGAGFFRELLLLGYRTENIHVDTSGTNKWREFLPKVMPLKEIFKRTIEVYGSEKVLYGTDTILGGTAGYRENVKKEQMKCLKDLKLSKKDFTAIMGGNTVRLFSL